MITNFNGDKVTPKQRANELIMDGISVTLGYWLEKDSDGMTEREKELVRVQMYKQADRIAKLCGYDKAWAS